MSHTALQNIEQLPSKFPDGYIIRNGAIKWPPRSSDLTSLDYFLCFL